MANMGTKLTSFKNKGVEEDDPICNIIGKYGPWQLKITFLLALCSFPCTFHIFATTFIGAEADFWCARPEHLQGVDAAAWRNYSQPVDACSMLQADWDSLTAEDVMKGPPPSAPLGPCTAWEWDRTDVGETIISEWNLVCERSWINKLSEMLFLAGVGIGGVVSGIISDGFGRKRTLLMALSIQTALGFTISFVHWYQMYLFLRMVLGFFSVSVVFAGFVLAMELVGGRWRAVAGVCNFLPLPVSYIIVSGVSMLLPNWRMLQFVLSLPGICLLSLWWLVPESPRWLLTVGRMDEVKEILVTAAAFNSKPVPLNFDKVLQPNDQTVVHNKSPGIKGLLNSKHRKITLCLFCIWFSITMVYYGLVLNMGKVGNNLHITSILGGVVEIPALALSIPMLIKLGRIYPISFSFLLAGLGCFGVAIADTYECESWVIITFMLISKCSVSATNGMLPMYTAELYPTLMRNMGVGSSQVSAGLALVTLPYLWCGDWVMPMSVTGCFGLLGAFCVTLLPDTSKISLTSAQNNDTSSEKPSDTPIRHTAPFTIANTKP